MDIIINSSRCIHLYYPIDAREVETTRGYVCRDETRFLKQELSECQDKADMWTSQSLFKPVEWRFHKVHKKSPMDK